MNNEMNINDLVLTAGENRNGLINEPGPHNVRIASIKPSIPQHKGTDFIDQDWQFAVTFKDADGRQFTVYYNRVAYKKYADLTTAEKQSGKFKEVEGFAVVKATGLRVAEPATAQDLLDAGAEPTRTDKAMAIFNGLVGATGVPVGSRVKVADLIGKELTIILGKENTPNPVTGNFDLRVKALKQVEA